MDSALCIDRRAKVKPAVEKRAGAVLVLRLNVQGQ
jgi:hypothetical protein